MTTVSIGDTYGNHSLTLVKKTDQPAPAGEWGFQGFLLNIINLKIVHRNSIAIDSNGVLIRLINDYALKLLNLKLASSFKVPALTLDWADYHVKIPKSQADTLSMDLVLQVLTQEGKSPIELANLQISEVAHPLLVELHKDFKNAIKRYKKLLDDAEKKDLAKIADLEKNHTVKSYSGLSGWIFQILQLCGANYRSIDFVETEGSAYRIKFFYDVNHEELGRHQKIKEKIDLALDPIIEDLGALKDRNQLDMNLLKQARQLVKVYRAVFPTEPLIKDGHTIDEILAEFTP